MSEITRRERVAIIQALSAGAVPPIGLRHIQVGRGAELAALLDDLDAVREGLSAVRILAGPTESGKTFLLNAARTHAVESGFVVAAANITTDHRLHGGHGEARALFGHLMETLTTREHPEGAGLAALLQRWLTNLTSSRQGSKGSLTENELLGILEPLFGLPNGFDFATVITRYHHGWTTHDARLQGSALRWLRAEYASPDQAQQDLGVRSIIDDSTFVQGLELFATFWRIAGYAGLLVNLDDLGVIAQRLRDPAERTANFEVVLQLIDDNLQGRMHGMAVFFAAERPALEDRQRGLFSHDILAKRLEPSRFATDAHRDFSSCVIWLDRLPRSDIPMLLDNVRRVFAVGDKNGTLLPDEGIDAFLQAYEDTQQGRSVTNPRDEIKDFVGLLRVLRHDRGADWEALIQEVRQREDSRAQWGAEERTLAPPVRQYRPSRAAAGGSVVSTRRVIGIGAGVLLLLILLLWGVMSLLASSSTAGGATLDVFAAPTATSQSRQSVHAGTIPVKARDYFGVRAALPRPMYAYVFMIDSTGRANLLHGANQDQPQESVEVSNEGSLIPVGAPGDSRTILLLASGQAVSDVEELTESVAGLSRPPQLGLGYMYVATERGIQPSRNPQADTGVEPDPGFLADLRDRFGQRFEVVSAFCFPVDAGRNDSILLYNP